MNQEPIRRHSIDGGIARPGGPPTVRCIIVSTQMVFCILVAMSSVSDAVEPPAPHVMSQNVGWYATMRSSRSYRFSTPSSVRGGKNSKEKKVCGAGGRVGRGEGGVSAGVSGGAAGRRSAR